MRVSRSKWRTLPFSPSRASITLARIRRASRIAGRRPAVGTETRRERSGVATSRRRCTSLCHSSVCYRCRSKPLRLMTHRLGWTGTCTACASSMREALRGPLVCTTASLACLCGSSTRMRASSEQSLALLRGMLPAAKALRLPVPPVQHYWKSANQIVHSPTLQVGQSPARCCPTCSCAVRSLANFAARQPSSRSQSIRRRRG
mmetsp:Transcript_131083/g.327037  ORF Transcript_131083/g.327037 Transcript_131083/m.327037 type:complete len:203 (+) Transcript_131083:401-1009(+)